MIEEFTASNGYKVVGPLDEGNYLLRADSSQLVATPVGPLSMQAFIEYAQAKRDQELGRWRDTVDPSYFVIKNEYDRVVVVDERSSRWTEVTPKIVADYPDVMVEHQVGARYFAAHPVSKPWHDAKPGEVWLMESDGIEYVMVAHMPLDDVRFRLSDKAGTIFDPKSTVFTGGRRVWPEES